MSDGEQPITMPSDIKSIIALVAIVASAAVAYSSLKGQSDDATLANKRQDAAIIRLSEKVDGIPAQLSELKVQNNVMLDLICDGDGARNRRGCKL